MDDDGHGDSACGGDDCDDSNPAIHPGFDETAAKTETVEDGLHFGSLGARRGVVRGVAVLEESLIMRPLSFGPGRRDTPDIDLRELMGPLDVRVAVDDTGALHVAAMNRRGGQESELWYWQELDGGWRTVAGPRQDASAELGSLAVGGEGGAEVRVSYSSYTDPGTMAVAPVTAGGWAPVTVYDTDTWGHSLQVDSTGSSHVVFHVADPADVLYGTDSSGEWVVESVLGPESAQESRSLVVLLDPSEAPILLYTRRDGRVLLSQRGSGQWEVEPVSSGAESELGHGLSAAADAAGRIHGVFIAGRGLGYFSGELGSWTTERPFTLSAPVHAVDMAVGSDGIHVLATTEEDLVHLLLPAPDGVDGDCDGVVY